MHAFSTFRKICSQITSLLCARKECWICSLSVVNVRQERQNISSDLGSCVCIHDYIQLYCLLYKKKRIIVHNANSGKSECWFTLSAAPPHPPTHPKGQLAHSCENCNSLYVGDLAPFPAGTVTSATVTKDAYLYQLVSGVGTEKFT